MKLCKVYSQGGYGYREERTTGEFEKQDRV